MKRIFNYLLLSLCGLFLFSAVAGAASFTFDDDTINWPGYDSATYTDDFIHQPDIQEVTVVIDDSTGYLSSISINIIDRLLWDNLFINVGGDGKKFDAWDFLVSESLSGGVQFRGVDDEYEYTLVESGGRVGHPNSIRSEDLFATDNLLASLSYTDNILEYVFKSDAKLFMGEGWAIGYTPYCANDVFFTPVPEPATMALLGFGLLGLAGISRKRNS